MYSVVISSVGRFNSLNGLLDSVEPQTLLANETLILLDENEHCRSITESWIQKPAVKVIFCERMNLAEKRNEGAKCAARYERIIYSDDDDIWDPRRAEELVQTLKDFPVCCHNYNKFGFENAQSLDVLGLEDREVGPATLFYTGNM